jgi:hypothetical protein
VSREESVKVRLVDVDPKTDKPEKGILRWQVDLPPRESRTLRFEFQVEYPEHAGLGNARELVRQIDFSM